MALPHGAMGLSAVYDCGISGSYPLTIFVQIIPLGPKMPPPRVHMDYIGLYRKNVKKIFLSKTKGLEP